MTEGEAHRRAERRVTALEAENARLRAALAAAGLDADGSSARALPPAGARFRTLADVTPQLVWRSEADGNWTWASPNWLAYTGQGEAESHGLGWLEAIHPEDRDRTMRAWHEVSGTRGQLDVEHRIRRAEDGAWRWHQTRSAPLREMAGPGVGDDGSLEWIGASADVEDLRRLEGEQHGLLHELRHRTRNLLAVVAAIARQSLSPVGGRDAFDARLASLGRVQGFLARTGAWTVSLRDLVEAELRASGDGAPGWAEVDGPSVELSGMVVQPIALALHELAANAAKHGAIAQPSGHLAVRWRLEGDAGATRLVIEWRESGVAMPPGPLPRGFGMRVIERTVPYQLGGEARLERGVDGIRCRLALPMGSRRAAA